MSNLKSKPANAIDHRWLKFSPHRRRSPDREVAQLVARYGKTMVRRAVTACKKPNHNTLADDWWLLATIREIGRQGWPVTEWMTKKDIVKFVGGLNKDDAETNKTRVRRRFKADKYLREKLLLLAGFIEIWPTIGIDERRWLVERAHALATQLDDRMSVYIGDPRNWSDSDFADRERSTGLVPDHALGALHQPQTALIADWLGRLVFA
jgi:hypothetical protein